MSATENPTAPKIIGKYRVLSVLGSGAMGQVFRAYDQDLQREVAIKLMNPFSSRSPVHLERFLREVRTVGRLRHRNIVMIMDFGTLENQPYLVMELLKGPDLFKLLGSSGPLPAWRSADITAQVCSGLAVAHGQGIVHRDVKPKNIIVTDSGLVKVVDFGIARIEDSNLTATGQIIGTVDYIAPERILGQKGDHRADIFSVGVMLFEMVAGQKPFGGTSVTAVLRNIVSRPPKPLPEGIPDEMAELVMRCMAKKPEERCANMAELIPPLNRIADQGRPANAPTSKGKYHNE